MALRRKVDTDVLVSARSEKHLRLGLKRIFVKVPPRHEKRQTWQAERYVLVRLLKSLPRYELALPVDLVQQEKPDFILRFPDHTVGIEATEAVHPKDAHQARVRGQQVADGEDVPDAYPIFVRSPGDAVDEPDPPDAPPCIGDEVEIRWVEAMAHSVAGKLAKLATYAATDRRWLLISDNWGVVALDRAKAFGMLHAKLAAMQVFPAWDRVFVAREAELLDLSVTGLVRRRFSKGRFPKGTRTN